KMIVADNTLVTIGSANYNFRSQTLSRELNVLYEDKRIANTVTTYIQELLQECRVITLEEAESYRDIRSWFNHLLMQVWG
ncbi:MAG: phospholipase D-like domain-containing protein, partial [Sphaerochaetaceae bacterium]